MDRDNENEADTEDPNQRAIKASLAKRKSQIGSVESKSPSSQMIGSVKNSNVRNSLNLPKGTLQKKISPHPGVASKLK